MNDSCTTDVSVETDFFVLLELSQSLFGARVAPVQTDNVLLFKERSIVPLFQSNTMQVHYHLTAKYLLILRK